MILGFEYSYQPAGDFYIAFNHDAYSSYERSLDLTVAEAKVAYQASRRPYRREYMAHLKEDLILARFHCEGAAFDCTVWLDRIVDPGCSVEQIATRDGKEIETKREGGLLRFPVEAETSIWVRLSTNS